MLSALAGILQFLVALWEIWCPHFEPPKNNLLSARPFYFQNNVFTELFTKITIIRKHCVPYVASQKRSRSDPLNSVLS